jgi:hypothetical protein
MRISQAQRKRQCRYTDEQRLASQPVFNSKNKTIAVSLVDDADLEALKGEDFLELTHGQGFRWPYIEVKMFEQALDTNDKPVTVSVRQ